MRLCPAVECSLLLLSGQFFLEGLATQTISRTRLSNNRSVKPLDALGRTGTALKISAYSPFPRGTGKPLNPIHSRDWGLQLFPVNQEFPVGTSHKLASIKFLPFILTTLR